MEGRIQIFDELQNVFPLYQCFDASERFQLGVVHLLEDPHLRGCKMTGFFDAFSESGLTQHGHMRAGIYLCGEREKDEIRRKSVISFVMVRYIKRFHRDNYATTF